MDPSVNLRRKILLHSVYRPHTAGSISFLQKESSKTSNRVRPWTADSKMRSSMSPNKVTRLPKPRVKSSWSYKFRMTKSDTTSNRTDTSSEDEGETKRHQLFRSATSPILNRKEGNSRHLTVKDRLSDEYDTDMEEDPNTAVEKNRGDLSDPSGLMMYETQCKKYGIVPISFLKRNLDKRSIRMRHHYLGGFDTRPVAAALQCNTVTESLDLSDNCIEDVGACYIARMLGENMFITSINLSRNFIRSLGVEAFASMLQENTTLKSLTFSSNQLQDRDAFRFIEALENNMSLTFLDLSDNNFGERGGEYFGAALTINETLTDLDLSWNGIRMKGAVAMANALKVNGTLEMLDLAWNGFGFPGAAALQESLQVNTTLKVLDLTNNHIHKEAGKKLAIGLEKNFGLVTLLLDMNPLGDEGVEAILKSVAMHETLKYLSIENCGEMSINNKNYQTIKEIKNEKHTVILHGGIGGFHRNNGWTSLLRMLKMFLHENSGHLEDVFHQHDKEHLGMLTQDEMAICLREAGLRLTSRQLQLLVARLDCSYTGKIKYSDVVSGNMFNNQKHESRNFKLAAKLVIFSDQY